MLLLELIGIIRLLLFSVHRSLHIIHRHLPTRVVEDPVLISGISLSIHSIALFFFRPSFLTVNLFRSTSRIIP